MSKRTNNHRWTAQQIATLRQLYPDLPSAEIAAQLGIGDDGCGDPEQTLYAIAELKAKKVGAGGTAPVTREMIGAAHDVMLAKGDFVLSANLLERIYLAMEQAAPPPQTPFDTCPTCEALARAVMMDQTGAA